MKLTRKQLRQIIQESILAEAPKKINVGDKVKAFWKEGDKKKPYPATVTKINNTTYTVEWDSGDGSDEVPKGDVVVIQKDPSDASGKRFVIDTSSNGEVDKGIQPGAKVVMKTPM